MCKAITRESRRRNAAKSISDFVIALLLLLLLEKSLPKMTPSSRVTVYICSPILANTITRTTKSLIDSSVLSALLGRIRPLVLNVVVDLIWHLRKRNLDLQFLLFWYIKKNAHFTFIRIRAQIAYTSTIHVHRRDTGAPPPPLGHLIPLTRKIRLQSSQSSSQSAPVLSGVEGFTSLELYPVHMYAVCIHLNDNVYKIIIYILNF